MARVALILAVIGVLIAASLYVSHGDACDTEIVHSHSLDDYHHTKGYHDHGWDGHCYVAHNRGQELHYHYLQVERRPTPTPTPTPTPAPVVCPEYPAFPLPGEYREIEHGYTRYLHVVDDWMRDVEGANYRCLRKQTATIRDLIWYGDK